MCGDGVDVSEVQRALSDAAHPAPSATYRAAELDPSGKLTQSLAMGAGDIWLVRPDAHTFACVQSGDEVREAVARVLQRESPAG